MPHKSISRESASLRSSAATDRLRDELLAQIDEAKLKEGDRILPLRELARRSGLAFASVQKVVKRLCREGFFETMRGRGTFVTGKRTSPLPPRSILFVYEKSLQSLPGSRLNHFYLHVLNGAEDEARHRGYGLLYKPVSGEIDEKALEELVGISSSAGALLVGEEIDHSLAFLLRREEKSLVLVDHSVDDGFDSILVDCSKGIRDALGSLFGLGHRRIGLVAGPMEFASVRQKLERFRRTHEDNRVRLHEELIRIYRHFDELPRLLGDMLGEENRPTAIMCGHDYAALQVIEAAGKMGLAVPRDLSVVGCDDLEPARKSSPALSTIQVDKEGMGRAAVQMLLERRKRPRTRYVPTRYIPRQSTGKARRWASMRSS